MKKLFIILSVLIVAAATGCGDTREEELIAQSKQLEHYRVLTTKDRYNRKDTLVQSLKSFQVFDSLNRCINKNDNTFYFYNEDNHIKKEIWVLKRDYNIRFIERDYKYNKEGNLVKIINATDSNSIVKELIYDDSNNPILVKGPSTIELTYKNGLVINRKILNPNDSSYVSNFELMYDSLNILTNEYLTFGDNNKVKTTFEYYPDGKLYKEIDSSYSTNPSPNLQVETIDEYHYDSNDSIVKVLKYHRIKSETEFKPNGRIIYTYEIISKK